MTQQRNSLKSYLAESCISSLTEKETYFSNADIRAYLVRHHIEIKSDTLVKYLQELCQNGRLYRAGRGWFTNLSQAFEINKQPIQQLIALVSEQFPHLKFSCWSTAQISPFMQHLGNRNIQFIHAERFTLSSIAEFLDSRQFNVLSHPSKRQMTNTHLKDGLIILRPDHVKAPVGGPESSIERLLVELRIEIASIPLMDIEEFHNLALAIVTSGRVDMAKLISYAQSRQLSRKNLFG